MTIRRTQTRTWLEHEPCDKCESRRWIWCHHSGDGHGGLNGGVWEYLPCGECNSGLIYPRRPDLGYYQKLAALEP